jgi:hypothetical protein
MRDLKLILGYAALFGSVVLALGYEAALNHKSPSQISASQGAASPAPSVSSSGIRQVLDRTRR